MKLKKLFHRKSKGDPPDLRAVQTTLLEARIDRIESDLRNIRAEWAEVYEKIMHLYDRIRKRDKRDKVAPEVVQTNPRAQIPFVRGSDVLKHYREIHGLNKQ